ncbi:DNA helicase, partial [Sarracenia purpurea var. burkii]
MPTPKEAEPQGDKGGGSGVPSGSDSQLLPRSTAFVTEALQGNDVSTSPFPSNDISLLPEVHTVESKKGIGSCDVTKSLHVLLKPKISKLCKILKFPDFEVLECIIWEVSDW